MQVIYKNTKFDSLKNMKEQLEVMRGQASNKSFASSIESIIAKYKLNSQFESAYVQEDPAKRKQLVD